MHRKFLSCCQIGHGCAVRSKPHTYLILDLQFGDVLMFRYRCQVGQSSRASPLVAEARKGAPTHRLHTPHTATAQSKDQQPHIRSVSTVYGMYLDKEQPLSTHLVLEKKLVECVRDGTIASFIPCHRLSSLNNHRQRCSQSTVSIELMMKVSSYTT